MNKTKKRGVSPLIATVILVAFSIALGAIVLNFTQKSTLDFSEQASNTIETGVKCNNVVLKLIDIEKNPCYNRSFSKNLEIFLENQGSEDIEGVVISIFDYENNIYTTRILETLTGHNRTRYNISLDENFKFPPIKAVLSAILSYNGNNLNVCTDNIIDVEEIDRC